MCESLLMTTEHLEYPGKLPDGWLVQYIEKDGASVWLLLQTDSPIFIMSPDGGIFEEGRFWTHDQLDVAEEFRQWVRVQFQEHRRLGRMPELHSSTHCSCGGMWHQNIIGMGTEDNPYRLDGVWRHYTPEGKQIDVIEAKP